MTRFSLTHGASGVVLGGAAAIVALGVGLYASGILFPSPESAPSVNNSAVPESAIALDADRAVDPKTAAALEQEAPAPVEREKPSDVAGSDLPEEQSAPGVNGGLDPEDAPAPDPEPPSFDIVRVAPDGQTLLAGTAPGARDVTILIDAVKAGTAEVDASGKFVAFLDLPSSDSPRVVGLVSDGELGRVESADQVILAPSVQSAAAPEPVTTDQTRTARTTEPEAFSDITTDIVERDPDAGPQDSISAALGPADPSETLATEAPVPSPQAVSEASSTPAVILSTEEGVAVLQPSGAVPQVLDQIALDAITYETAGDVALTGRGAVDEFVRIYLDNDPILTTEVGEDGRWTADLPQIDSGTYTLRVDAVDDTGTVTSRVESPFRREDPEALAAVVDDTDGAPDVTVVTVQPGNTLWAIARDRYGEGPAYVKVFEANRDRIRNPDLIYPGQVFQVPD
ncbi:LysM peptidoglycan-binding domain-containing protein [Marivita sp. S0852]|uniref:LysM peptidoglycan-binding domain-containing protein n=1 Tax=Marivita sp. S0852 TaxID=3373893 RepID=UPI0039824DFA